MASSIPADSPAVELLSLRHVSLDYGEIEAIRNVSLTICSGEIHAIVGEHGAGKSTLAMIMAGMLHPKSGTIYYKGKEANPFTLKTALKLRIRMVYQQLYLNEYFTVAENILYASKFIKYTRWPRFRRMTTETINLLKSHAFMIDSVALVKNLSLSDRAVVDILKQVHELPDVLILDETLEKLSADSFNKIVKLLLELRQSGTSIVFITHRIDDIYNFADKVTIVRNGELIFTDHIKHIDKINLIRLAYTQFSYQTQVTDASLEFRRFLRYSDAILQHLPVSILVTDSDYRAKMTNEQFHKFSRLGRSECENRRIEDILTPEDPGVLDSIYHALGSREERSTYHVAFRVEDQTALANIRSFPIIDDDQVIGYILVIEDITEYDHLQQQVLLSDKLASVGLLAAGVAHEINNPLEIIYNYIRFIKRSFQDQKLHESIDRLTEEVTNIATIVSNLTTFSDTNKIASEEVELNEAMRNLLDLLSYNSRYNRIHLQFYPTKFELKIIINKNELRQVILNLIKNSLEAMPDGGDITVTTGLKINQGMSVAVITVRDNGPGINQSKLKNVFLPFYSTKRGQGDNLGLGLSISYSIMEKHGGGIDVKNLAGGGCEFAVWMPVALQP